MEATYDFHGKTAVVVGGASGMGLSTAELLAASNAKVAIADMDEKNGEAEAEKLRGKGYTAEFFPCNITDKKSVFDMIDAVVAKFGRLDLAANIAGVNGNGDKIPFWEKTDAEYEKVMNINVKGQWNLCQAETKQMVSQGGDGYAIVIMSSLQAYVASPYNPTYAVSKTAVTGLIRSLGGQFVQQGIRVNGVAPIAVLTPLAIKSMERMGMTVTDKTPFNPRGYMLKPEEVANVIVWLLSDASSSMNAATVVCDCGATGIKNNKMTGKKD